MISEQAAARRATPHERTLSPEAMVAIQAAAALGLSSLRADAPQTLSEWAAEHFLLAGESSHQKGGWVGWPFQLGILDFMSDDRIEELAVKRASAGYTKMITAFVAYNIAHRRRKQALWQPTDDDRDSYVKSEIEPVLDGVAAVQAARRQGKGWKTPSNTSPFATACCTCWAARPHGPTAASPWPSPSSTNGAPSTRASRNPATPAAGQGPAGGRAIPQVRRRQHAPRQRHVPCGARLRRIRRLRPVPHRMPRCGAEHPLVWSSKELPYGFKWVRPARQRAPRVCPTAWRASPRPTTCPAAGRSPAPGSAKDRPSLRRRPHLARCYRPTLPPAAHPGRTCLGRQPPAHLGQHRR